jgi:hypothetical protein
MDRIPPLDVQRTLRREVNFGCPVPGCAEPFLSWHHFDPHWHVRQHHDPQGMIALCWKHHRMAEKVFTSAQLRHFKSNPNQLDEVTGRFEWLGSEPLIRIGGCYAPGWCRIDVNGAELVRVESGMDGLLSVNFVLRNQAGELLAVMQDNMLTAHASVFHDLAVTASGHRSKIWLAERRIGLELEYCLMNAEEIEKLVAADTPDIDPGDIVDPPEPIADLDAFYAELSRVATFMDLIPICYRRCDPVGTTVRWHAARQRGSDGRFPVLNFVSCRLWNGGRLLEMRNGRMDILQFCGGNTFNFAGADVAF